MAIKQMWIILLSLTMFACGGGETDGGDLPDGAVGGGDAIEYIFPDVQEAETPDEDFLNQEIETEVVVSLTECLSGADCPTGFCVDAPDGKKYCALECYEECPKGWTCKGVLNVQNDLIFICLPLVQRLCRPCMENGDCRPKDVETNDLCVDFGGNGKFCGADCETAKTCPEGYECKEIANRGLKTYFQCLPISGECACAEDFITNGYKTECYKANEHGTCYGERKCTVEGLTECDAKEPKPEECNNLDDNCDGGTDEGIVLGDCEVSNDYGKCTGKYFCDKGEVICSAAVPTEEVCDGIDNDCDGSSDTENSKGCVTYFIDGDGDSYGLEGDSKCLCGADPPYGALVKGDCEDNDKDVNPSAFEQCNEKDDNCNTLIDEGGAVNCITYYKDVDGDGYGSLEWKCLCAPDGDYNVTTGGDCNDGDFNINPGAVEKCNGKDDNCDNQIDPENTGDCSIYYYDNDADEWGVEDIYKCLCSASGKYTAQKYGDCDENNAQVNPGMPEKCGTNSDDNCNNDANDLNAEGCSLFYADNDLDGYGSTLSGCYCSAKPPYTVNITGDCNDNDPDIKPSAVENCSTGYDDNCNNEANEKNGMNCKYFYYDFDSDGYGTMLNECWCAQSGYFRALQSGDCEDGKSWVNPGAQENCSTPEDDNCNGPVNELNAQNCKNYHQDSDGDTYGSSAYQCWCSPSGIYKVQNMSDCNDSDPNIKPGIPENCGTSYDDNCNGQTNEQNGTGCSYFYHDGDSDSWGTSSSQCWCAATFPYTAAKSGDCNDNCSTCYPGGTEVCDYLDNDCDSTPDDGFIEGDANYYLDVSGSGTWCGYVSSPWYDYLNIWYGLTLGCRQSSGSNNFSFSGRILPGSDADWIGVWSGEYDNWDANLKCKVQFTGVSGESYEVCACWSQVNQCDQASMKCATSTGGMVAVQVDNDDSWGSDDQGWCDISIKGKGAGDYNCSKYNLTVTIWE